MCVMGPKVRGIRRGAVVRLGFDLAEGLDEFVDGAIRRSDSLRAVCSCCFMGMR